MTLFLMFSVQFLFHLNVGQAKSSIQMNLVNECPVFDHHCIIRRNFCRNGGLFKETFIHHGLLKFERLLDKDWISNGSTI